MSEVILRDRAFDRRLRIHPGRNHPTGIVLELRQFGHYTEYMMCDPAKARRAFQRAIRLCEKAMEEGT